MKPLLTTLLVGLMLVQSSAQTQPPPPPEPSATDEAVKLYAAATGRTILRPSLLPRLPESIAARLLVRTNDAAEFIEAQLEAQGIEVVRGGSLFALILPEGWKETPLAAQLARIKLPPERDSSASVAGDQPPPTLTADFEGFALEQLLAVYSQLRNRTVLRPAVLPSVRVRFSTQTSLTKAEAAYGLNVVLAMNGLAAIDDGDKFVQVVPLPRFGQVVAKAPKAEADAPAGDPRNIPVFRPGAGRDAGARPTVNDLVAFYTGLTNRSPEVSIRAGSLPVYFEIRNPVTVAELTYAIETTLALNGVVIVPGEGRNSRVVLRSEVQKPEQQ